MSISIEQKLINIHHYNIDPDHREIYLHSYISENEDESGVDYRCAINFEKNLRYLNSLSSDPILIHMHMPGGDWSDALGIYDSILHSSSPTAILAYSKAESASGLLLQAANLRILMPNSYMLIHYGSLFLDGEHQAAMSNIKWNEKEADKMIDIFTNKSIGSLMSKEKNWKKPMIRKHIVSQLSNKSDWILNPEEAVYYGFADGVFGSAPYGTVESIKKRLLKK